MSITDAMRESIDRGRDLLGGCPDCCSRWEFASYLTSPPRIDYECGARWVLVGGGWRPEVPCTKEDPK